jgi:hypothetical protein
MEKASSCLFETPLGPCGIAWQEAARPGLGQVVQVESSRAKYIIFGGIVLK